MSNTPLPPDNSEQPENPYATPQAQQMASAAATDTQGDATGGLIPYKNKCALIGYYVSYVGIFVPVIGGIASVVLGIMGLIAKKKNPAVSGTFHAIWAIVVGIGTVVFWLTCGSVMLAPLFM